MMMTLPGMAGTSGHPWRRALDKRLVLPLCIVVSLAAHLLLLTRPATSEPPRQAAHASSQSPASLLVRVLRREAAAVSKAAADPGPSPADAPAPLARSMADARRASRGKPAPEAPTEPAAATPPMAVPSTATAPDTPMVATPAATTEHDDYVPRPLLSVPPAARSPVIIDTPSGEWEPGRRVGILSLFIDEDGRVQHIAANEPALPPAFEKAAIEAFMATRFSPGQIDGRAVKSRVRVEVVFDSMPMTSTNPQTGP